LRREPPQHRRAWPVSILAESLFSGVQSQRWHVIVANGTDDVGNLGFAVVLGDLQVAQLMYDATAAAGYERGFARISSHFIPFLLGAAGVSAGHRALDVATGTGLAAGAALALVGPTGHVTATDLSPQMVERARERLRAAPNAAIQIEDGQVLGLPDGSFDAVICSLGLMFFPDPARGLNEFRRVLRSGGRAAVSVNTVPERSYNTRIHPIIARYVPSLATDAARLFSLGNAQKLGALFAAAGFRDVKITTERHRFGVGSFDEYFDHVERGWGSSGQVFVSLSPDTQRAVREDVRRDVGDAGGPIEIEVEFMFGSGEK
jgi:ubiquinone/menaquinone biosynthesis C-methylase UbiE